MNVFAHQLYECKKGVRSMALATLHPKYLPVAQRKIVSADMSYHIYFVSDSKVNVFFGKEECIDVIKKMCDKPLNMLSVEEDFILGAMLGYSICEQCKRYCLRKQKMADQKFTEIEQGALIYSSPLAQHCF